MPSLSSLDRAQDLLQLSEKPDGVVVLAYPGKTGGCGKQLLELIEQLAATLPVLVVQPGSGEFTSSVVNVQPVTANPGPQQDAEIVAAMRNSSIRLPVMILLDPSLSGFWQRAFAAGRLFALTETFRLSIEEAEGIDPDFERHKAEHIVLLERTVQSVLVEDEDGLEWIRSQFVYCGDFHRIDKPGPAPSTAILEFIGRQFGTQSRFPHRLDILLLVDGSGEGRNQAAAFSRTSRHHAYLGLKKVSTDQLPNSPIDYSAFDVVLVISPGDVPATDELDERVLAGLTSFKGLKGLVTASLAGGEAPTQRFASSTGCHFVVPLASISETQNAPTAIDSALSCLMPGLPNWLLHQAGKFVPYPAAIHGALATQFSTSTLLADTPTDPLGELRALEKECGILNEELEAMRAEIASLDGEISALKERQRPPAAQQKTGFLNRLLSKFTTRNPTPGN